MKEKSSLIEIVDMIYNSKKGVSHPKDWMAEIFTGVICLGKKFSF